MTASWSMHEILPRGDAPGFTSPPTFGELSLLSPSEFEVQRIFPVKYGLLGNSRMFESSATGAVVGSAEFLKPAEFAGLRKTSITLGSLLLFVTTTMAFRSLTEFQIFPARSKAIPSVPSRRG